MTTFDSIKLCKDCKYFSGVLTLHCDHPKAGIDLVSGSSKSWAFEMRRGECGPEAHLFEPGPSDAAIKGKEISRLARRDTMLVLVGIFALSALLVWLVVGFAK